MLDEKQTIRMLWCVVGVILLVVVLVLCCVRRPDSQQKTDDTQTEQEFVRRCKEKFESLPDVKAMVCVNDRYRVRLER